MSDLSKYREELARALNDCDPLALDNTHAEWALMSIADALLASPVLARVVAEAKAEALREAAEALSIDFRHDGWPTPWLREQADRAEASGREGER